MTENYEQLLVNSETLEPFVLCIALGTLEIIKSRVWSSEAGIWTIGRPIFWSQLGESKVSDETINILSKFDELSALELVLEKDEFNKRLIEIEHNIKKRLGGFSGNFWYAKWLNERV